VAQAFTIPITRNPSGMPMMVKHRARPTSVIGETSKMRANVRVRAPEGLSRHLVGFKSFCFLAPVSDFRLVPDFLADALELYLVAWCDAVLQLPTVHLTLLADVVIATRLTLVRHCTCT
jgi:hypothetical protein